MIDFAKPHFAEPAWLWLAVLAPLALVALQRYSAWARRRQLNRVAGAEFAAELTRSHSRLRREVKEWLLVATVVVGGLAMARPQWGEQEDAWQVLGQDVIFVLDGSRSMLATDVAPSRLHRAKLSILDYVQRHGQGRFGLVAFAGQAFLQCPLTFDYGAFQEALLAVDDKSIPIPGTDVGRALEEGFHAMDKSERQKLLILLTDGEDLEKRGLKTAQQLAKEGVVVFCLGVGTPAGSQIQLIDERGQATLLRDSKGEVVRSQLDETTLRGIATATRGAYYPLGPVGEGLEKVRVAVEAQDFGAAFAPARKLGVERFHWFVAALLVVLVVESLIGTRRRAGKGEVRSSKSEVRSSGLVKSGAVSSLSVLVVLAVFGWLPAKGQTKSERELETPRDFFNAGTRKLEERKFREAEALLESALARQVESLQPLALYNLGQVRYAQGIEALEKGPDAGTVSARGESAERRAADAVRAAEEALASEQVQAMVAAYMRGRGTRRELKAAIDAVKQALQAHGDTLAKWQRASGDFHGATELDRRDADARFNADVVDRSIAKLVDRLRRLQQMANALGQMREELKEKMKQLKGRIPEPDMPPGAAGEDEEEEEQPMGQDPGQKEAPGREGEEMQLTPEQAGWLLEGFKLDKERRLPMGQSEQSQPRDRNRPTW